MNCKQRLMFHQGTLNDNKFMSVDASQFCSCRNPTNCLLSMNKSARQCMLCNESVKHGKSVGLTHSHVKTDIELLISLIFSTWEHIKSDRKNRHSYDAFFNLNQNCEQIIFIQSAKLFLTLKNSPFSLAQGILIHVRALDLIPCLIPCHRCEKSLWESRHSQQIDPATWQHPRDSHRHVRGSAQIYDVRMAQFVLKIEKWSHIC